MVWNKNLAFVVVSVSIIMLLGGVEGWKMFHRGRGRGGMLGSPKAAPNTTVPPAEWFLQLLDHFNPTVVRTWEQVKNIIFIWIMQCTEVIQSVQCYCAQVLNSHKFIAVTHTPLIQCTNISEQQVADIT
jgi:hypothetical protein